MAKNNDTPSESPGGGARQNNPSTGAGTDLKTGISYENPLWKEAADALNRSARANEDQVTFGSVDSSRAYLDNGGLSSGTSTTGALSQLAQDTIRQALGWRYLSGDVKGFSAAINRAFTLTQDTDGVVDWTWTPQTYAIQADLGEITGAQASIFEQAKVTINFMLPLLDGLKALRADSDDDDIKALTAIVRMKLNSMLTELGRVGGPRVQRLDLLHEELLGRPIMEATIPPGGKLQWAVVPISDFDDWKDQLKKIDQTSQPRTVPASYTINERGQKKRAYSLLRQLGQELGIAPELANNIEEERDLTNYMIIVDSAIAMRTAWIGKRKFFNRFGCAQSFLGTQLVWLSRQIEVVAETVRAAYAAMDSVYFGPQERQATDIFFESVATDDPPAKTEVPQNEAAITVGDLLDWVETFATQEGPQLLQEAGKDGVLSFRATVKRLEEWVKAARIFSETDPSSSKTHAPRSFFTRRVTRALREIELQLDATAARTDGITRSTRLSHSDYVELADLPGPVTEQVRDIGFLNGNSTNASAQ